MTDPDKGVSRRSVLAAVGTTSVTAALAGCSDDESLTLEEADGDEPSEDDSSGDDAGSTDEPADGDGASQDEAAEDAETESATAEDDVDDIDDDDTDTDDETEGGDDASLVVEVYQDDEPVDGVDVIVDDGEQTLAETTDDGDARFEDLSPGAVTVVADVDDEHGTDELTLDDGENRLRLTLGSTSEREEAWLTVGQSPRAVNPLEAVDVNTQTVVEQAYEPLLAVDGSELVAHLATDWSRPSDRVIAFDIREDVVFHDGSPMTAEDVAFSINLAIDSTQSDVAFDLDTIEEAQAIGEFTVEVGLTDAAPTALYSLAAYCRILNRDWIESTGVDALEAEMNGTGPFELEHFEADHLVEYRRFGDYWGDEPTPQEARITGASEEDQRRTALESGESDIVTDLSPESVPSIQGNDELRLETIPSPTQLFIALPNDEGPLASQAVRQALNYAVDVEAIVDGILDGFATPTSQPSLPGTPGHDPALTPYGYDPSRAEALIEESGESGAELTVVTPQGRYASDVEIAEAVVTAIDTLANVNAELELWDFARLVDTISSGEMADSPDAFLIGWGDVTLGGTSALENWFLPESPFQHFRDDEIEDVVLGALDEPDEGRHERLLEEANTLAHERAGWLYLFQYEDLYGVAEGVDWNPSRDGRVRLANLEFSG